MPKPSLSSSIFAAANSILLLAAGGISLSSFAIQPMSSLDLENVSAELGDNLLTVLNVAGNPAAGLRDDSLKTRHYKEGSAAEPLATEELRSLEQPVIGRANATTIPAYDQNDLKEAVSAAKQTVGSATAFSTNSEITYLDSNYRHTMTQSQDGRVIVNRDLTIDLLKLENLRGDSNDRGASAGSIYISDWHSIGETAIK